MVHSSNASDFIYAGKTFGRLGSGEENLPENTTGFRYDGRGGSQH